VTSRDNLHAMIEELPHEKLLDAQRWLQYVLKPPQQPVNPALQAWRRRVEQFRAAVANHYRETRTPATLFGQVWGGGGATDLANVGVDYQCEGYANASVQYWDGAASVIQTLRLFDGHELESMERLSLSQDGATLVYQQELACAGQIARQEQSFRVNPRPFRDAVGNDKAPYHK
jgi:hypothetical protein